MIAIGQGLCPAKLAVRATNFFVLSLSTKQKKGLIILKSRPASRIPTMSGNIYKNRVVVVKAGQPPCFYSTPVRGPDGRTLQIPDPFYYC